MRAAVEPYRLGPALTRRQVLGLSAAVAAGAMLPWQGRAAAETIGAPWAHLPDFASPPARFAPKFRWWWPNGEVDLDEIAREVDAVADAGCGGLEVADVHHSGLLTLDIERFGWGSPQWVAALDRALTQAVRRGISIDLTIGPSWPAAVPTITPDSPAASRELAHGVVAVAGGSTYSGPVPRRPWSRSPTRPRSRPHSPIWASRPRCATTCRR
ncbi:MAG TPA: glycosyl hydrolase [Jatrophihabitantaceae bacterium]|nr:glycosyl hydrolase [Jatrophihabitantaceae bacterium]